MTVTLFGKPAYQSIPCIIGRRLSLEKPSVWPLVAQLHESYLFERRVVMNSAILRNEARQLKNFAVLLSY